MVKVSVLVLSLNLLGRISVFHHWILCCLWVCHKWLLLCWDMFPWCPIWWENSHGCWILWSFLSIYCDDHIFLVFSFVDMAYHIDWFKYVESSLWPWNESKLIIVYNTFYVLLGSVCSYFVDHSHIYVHQIYWP